MRTPLATGGLFDSAAEPIIFIRLIKSFTYELSESSWKNRNNPFGFSGRNMLFGEEDTCLHDVVRLGQTECQLFWTGSSCISWYDH